MNNAHDPLEKVKDVLRDFLKDIEEIQSIRKNIVCSSNGPGLHSCG